MQVQHYKCSLLVKLQVFLHVPVLDLLLHLLLFATATGCEITLASS